MNTPALPSPLRTRLQPVLYISAFLLAVTIFAALIHFASSKSVLGADYYTFWAAGKALFLEGTDPYSPSVTQAAQLGKLGRLAQPGEDQLAYAYPVYGLFAVLPTVFLEFDWATAFWMAFNILSFLTILFLVLPPPGRGLALTSMLMFPVFLSFVLGTFDILLAAGVLIFFGLIAAQGKRSWGVQILAGMLLAWATIKPQFIWLALGFALLYALRERLYPFLVTFFASLVFFFGLSFLLVPGWIGEWIMRVQEYAGYVQSKGRPTLSLFLSPFLPDSTALLITGIIFAVCTLLTAFWLVRWWRGQLHWLKLLAWLGMLTYLFHLHGISYEQLIFLLPLILWIGQKESWRKKEVLGFWIATLIVSWLGLALGRYHLAFDRSPVLLNALWVGWLFAKSRFQL